MSRAALYPRGGPGAASRLDLGGGAPIIGTGRRTAPGGRDSGGDEPDGVPNAISQLCREKGAELRYLEVDERGELSLEQLEARALLYRFYVRLGMLPDVRR